MNITTYIKDLTHQFKTGTATEHTHRPALQTLLKSSIPDALITNEPKHIACGAPDFVLTKGQIPFGYIEAKDIGKNLDDAAYTEQLKRYTESLDNLIFTNYLEFRLIREGKQVGTIHIASLKNAKIVAKPDQFAAFTDLITTFADYQGQTITTDKDLAKHMAHKARMLAATIAEALHQDLTNPKDAKKSALQNQLEAFQKHLINDLKPAAFADVYAQTVAYGMFAARLHDETLDSFTRQEAAELIPSTNPFLRKFFQHIAGYDLDPRIKWIINDLADLFRATNVGELMKNYGKATQQDDPFIHFYETFLGEYNPKLRKSRGVYYTPKPVVNFIVRAVDSLLCDEFGLSQGLADTTKTTIKIKKIPKEVHKVQILDPATGTGTFLAEIVQHIFNNQFANQKGIWADYVKTDLIPRLNGFEVLMASYAMAHTKLEMVIRDSGGELGDERLRIFLTNSLEEHHPDTGTLFAQWLSDEANEANFIKRDTPVMVVIGNPPYSGESANKGKWISEQMNDYKQEPNGGKLQEKNSKWLNDDYAKFIRYGQYYVDKTGEGILAYVNNHSFLDNPTFRGMRWNLLKSFDKIYIIDLHGNSRKKEVAPDGSNDKNVFDIMQGVSINIFIKTGKKQKTELAEVFHYDIYGERKSKYQFLWENDLKQVKFKKLKPQAPQYFFIPKDYNLQAKYDKGFSVNAIFPINSVGIVTARDNFTIHHTPQKLQTTIAEFRAIDDETARERFSLGADVQDWNISLARKDLETNIFDNKNDQPTPIYYRPFDLRYTYYTGTSKGFHCRPRGKIMQHFLKGENIGITLCRQSKGSKSYYHTFITKNIFESSMVSNQASGTASGFPLYLYPDPKQLSLDTQTRKPNLDPDIVATIAQTLGLNFTPEKQANPKTFAPIDLLDYIYAVLHSPTYRERYQEFLKTDFPRIPYPTDKKLFRQLAKFGAELRTLHLLEHPTLNTLTTAYPESGDNIVIKPTFEITNPKTKIGKVHINPTQYFQNIPELAWNFHIGGYQPAQKYLKDRKTHPLTYNEITHYQKIILTLTKTADLMQKIDEVGW